MTQPLEISGIPKGPMPRPPPAFVIRIVIALRRFLLRLADRLLPPELVVFERVTGVAYTAGIATLAKGGYAELLADGPLTAAEIATRTQQDADAVFRFLHLFAAVGYVTMDADGRFGTTPFLRALRADNPMRLRAFVEYYASRSNIDAWLDIAGTLKTGKNAFARVHGAMIWDYFDAHPEERENFAHAMMGMTLGDAPFVARLYPFDGVTTVCDVGGGRGTLLSEVLLRHPNLRGILAENPGVLASAKSLLAHRGVDQRVRLEPSSFFEKVPEGADLYMLKHVLHDWDDATCRTILRTVRRAMQPGQRLLVIEGFLDRSRPDPIVSPSDVQMMVVCAEGRERTLDELRGLLRDSGFTPSRTFALPILGMLEGVAS